MRKFLTAMIAGLAALGIGIFILKNFSGPKTSVDPVGEYSHGVIFSEYAGSTSTVLYFNDELQQVGETMIPMGSLTSEYTAPWADEENIIIPYCGSVAVKDIKIVKLKPKTGEMSYEKDRRGAVDTVFKDGEKIFYTGNLNAGGYLSTAHFNDSEEILQSAENMMVTNGGRLGDYYYLISMYPGIEEGENGTHLVFYDQDLNRIQEYTKNDFSHRGPSVVKDGKIYYMSSDVDEEDKCIYSVDDNGSFEKIPLKIWAYRIEAFEDGIIINGGDENKGSYVIINSMGEQFYFTEEEKEFMQMKYKDGFLYTLDRGEENPVLRKYKINENSMEKVLEKEIEFTNRQESVTSIF